MRRTVSLSRSAVGSRLPRRRSAAQSLLRQQSDGVSLVINEDGAHPSSSPHTHTHTKTSTPSSVPRSSTHPSQHDHLVTMRVKRPDDGAPTSSSSSISEGDPTSKVHVRASFTPDQRAQSAASAPPNVVAASSTDADASSKSSSSSSPPPSSSSSSSSSSSLFDAYQSAAATSSLSTARPVMPPLAPLKPIPTAVRSPVSRGSFMFSLYHSTSNSLVQYSWPTTWLQQASYSNASSSSLVSPTAMNGHKPHQGNSTSVVGDIFIGTVTSVVFCAPVVVVLSFVAPPAATCALSVAVAVAPGLAAVFFKSGMAAVGRALSGGGTWAWNRNGMGSYSSEYECTSVDGSKPKHEKKKDLNASGRGKLSDSSNTNAPPHRRQFRQSKARRAAAGQTDRETMVRAFLDRRVSAARRESQFVGSAKDPLMVAACATALLFTVGICAVFAVTHDERPSASKRRIDSSSIHQNDQNSGSHPHQFDEIHHHEFNRDRNATERAALDDCIPTRDALMSAARARRPPHVAPSFHHPTVESATNSSVLESTGGDVKRMPDRGKGHPFGFESESTVDGVASPQVFTHAHGNGDDEALARGDVAGIGGDVPDVDPTSPVAWLDVGLKQRSPPNTRY